MTEVDFETRAKELEALITEVVVGVRARLKLLYTELCDILSPELVLHVFSANEVEAPPEAKARLLIELRQLRKADDPTPNDPLAKDVP